MSRLPPILEIATRAKGRIGWWPALSVMSLLGLGALTILLLIFHTSQSQDELAQQSERALARTLMAQQGGHLAKLAFDYTHLGREGADFFATMITRELAAAVPSLRKYLIP